MKEAKASRVYSISSKISLTIYLLFIKVKISKCKLVLESFGVAVFNTKNFKERLSINQDNKIAHTPPKHGTL